MHVGTLKSGVCLNSRDLLLLYLHVMASYFTGRVLENIKGGKTQNESIM